MFIFNMNLNEIHLKLKMNLKFIENDFEMACSSQFIINIQLWIFSNISIIQLKYSIQFVNMDYVPPPPGRLPSCSLLCPSSEFLKVQEMQEG